jgi:hypothetical protein
MNPTLQQRPMARLPRPMGQQMPPPSAVPPPPVPGAAQVAGADRAAPAAAPLPTDPGVTGAQGGAQGITTPPVPPPPTPAPPPTPGAVTSGRPVFAGPSTRPMTGMSAPMAPRRFGPASPATPPPTARPLEPRQRTPIA